MRIAFVANKYLDPRTPNSWSGLPFYFIRRSLESAGVEIDTFVLEEPSSALKPAPLRLLEISPRQEISSQL